MRGRGLSFVYAVGTISLATGGLLWGAVGRAYGPATSMIAAGFSLLLVLAVTNKLSISAPSEKLATSATDA
jgi:uncharacterized PurR-regulated membrane protein YhhQ (DUF165 family)